MSAPHQYLYLNKRPGSQIVRKRLSCQLDFGFDEKFQ